MQENKFNSFKSNGEGKLILDVAQLPKGWKRWSKEDFKVWFDSYGMTKEIQDKWFKQSNKDLPNEDEGAE